MVDKLISIGGAILFSLFIVFDTHMMMHKLSPEEYMLAAINLYLDILNLFLHILKLLGEQRNWRRPWYDGIRKMELFVSYFNHDLWFSTFSTFTFRLV